MVGRKPRPLTQRSLERRRGQTPPGMGRALPLPTRPSVSSSRHKARQRGSSSKSRACWHRWHPAGLLPSWGSWDEATGLSQSHLPHHVLLAVITGPARRQEEESFGVQRHSGYLLNLPRPTSNKPERIRKPTGGEGKRNPHSASTSQTCLATQHRHSGAAPERALEQAAQGFGPRVFTRLQFNTVLCNHRGWAGTRGFCRHCQNRS